MSIWEIIVDVISITLCIIGILLMFYILIVTIWEILTGEML